MTDSERRRMADLERRRTNYAYKKEHHLCVNCGTKIETGVRCPACHAKVYGRVIAHYKKLKSENKCQCGKDVVEGKSLCAECAAYYRNLSKTRYQYRKENHLCVNCGEPCSDDKATCLKCREIYNAKAREKYKQMSEDEKAKLKEKKREYAKKHPEKVKEYTKRFQLKHKNEHSKKVRDEDFEW